MRVICLKTVKRFLCLGIQLANRDKKNTERVYRHKPYDPNEKPRNKKLNKHKRLSPFRKKDDDESLDS